MWGGARQGVDRLGTAETVEEAITVGWLAVHSLRYLS